MTTDTAPQFKPEAIGKSGDPVEFEVTKDRIAAYAAATNDPLPGHASGEIAPPVFAIVPAFQAAGMASMQVIPGELLGAILHGEQDFHYHRPIEPGMKVLSFVANAPGEVVEAEREKLERYRRELDALSA